MPTQNDKARECLGQQKQEADLHWKPCPACGWAVRVVMVSGKVKCLRCGLITAQLSKGSPCLQTR